MDRHHRIEQEGKVDPLGFASKLERRTITVEGKRPLRRSHINGRFVTPVEQPFLHLAVRSPINELDRPFAKGNERYHSHDLGWLNP